MSVPTRSNVAPLHTSPRRCPRTATTDQTRLISSLIVLRFCKQSRVGLARMLVRLAALLLFISLQEPLLLRPAIVHAFEAPFNALARRADWFAVHQDEDGICVRRWQNAQRHPTAVGHVHIERHVAKFSIG